MDTSNSACSSGCESGWTTYFDQTSNHTGSFNPGFVRPFDDDDDEGYAKGAYAYADQETDGQDLSMVSDASSAPPIPDEFSGGGRLQKKNKQKKKIIKKQQNLCLDDTATSPFCHFSQDNVRSVNNTIVSEGDPYLARGTAVENFEGESTRKRHLGFLKSSIKGKSSEGLLGRKKQ